jgi:hypothetical protein
MLERMTHGGRRVGHRRGIFVGERPHDPIVGQFDIQTGSTIFEMDAHGEIQNFDYLGRNHK